eukprot:2737088-Prymnesium_polylepis.1
MVQMNGLTRVVLCERAKGGGGASRSAACERPRAVAARERAFGRKRGNRLICPSFPPDPLAARGRNGLRRRA